MDIWVAVIPDQLVIKRYYTEITFSKKQSI